MDVSGQLRAPAAFPLEKYTVKLIQVNGIKVGNCEFQDKDLPRS
jgi:hypothetical protein